MSRGKFIVLEGADGAGTTTMSWALADLLAAHYGDKDRVLRTHEPSTGKIGLLIRDLLKTHKEPLNWRMMSYLFMADRIQHVREEIRPALEAGKDVICDRYYPSTCVYQAASAPEDLGVAKVMPYLAREMAGLNVIPLNDVECGDEPWEDPLWLEPDLTFFLVVSPSVLERRRKSRGNAQEMYEAEKTQRRVVQLYEWWFNQLSSKTVRIDASRIREEVRKSCWTIACALLHLVDDESVHKLLDEVPLRQP